MGQTRPLFFVFRPIQQQFQQKTHRDSNSNRRSKRRTRWPLHHHHGQSLSLSLFQRNDHDSPHSSKKKFCDQSEHSMLFVFLFVNTFAEVGSEPTTIWQLRLTATSSSPRPEELLNKIKLLSDVPFESINTIYPSKSASDNPFAPWNDLNIFCKHSDFN